MSFKQLFATPKGFEPRPALLQHSQIPKGLHGHAPRVVLGQEWWDKQRQAAYAKYGYRCWACGSDENEEPLEAHECYDFNFKDCVATLHEVVALCSQCHQFIHSGLLYRRVFAGEIEEAAAIATLQRGEQLLMAAGLSMQIGTAETMAFLGMKHKARLLQRVQDFRDCTWKIIVEGREYNV